MRARLLAPVTVEDQTWLPGEEVEVAETIVNIDQDRYHLRLTHGSRNYFAWVEADRVEILPDEPLGESPNYWHDRLGEIPSILTDAAAALEQAADIISDPFLQHLVKEETGIAAKTLGFELVIWASTLRGVAGS